MGNGVKRAGPSFSLAPGEGECPAPRPRRRQQHGDQKREGAGVVERHRDFWVELFKHLVDAGCFLSASHMSPSTRLVQAALGKQVAERIAEIHEGTGRELHTIFEAGEA